MQLYICYDSDQIVLKGQHLNTFSISTPLQTHILAGLGWLSKSKTLYGACGDHPPKIFSQEFPPMEKTEILGEQKRFLWNMGDEWIDFKTWFYKIIYENNATEHKLKYAIDVTLPFFS